MSAKWLFTFKHFKFPLLPLLTHSALVPDIDMQIMHVWVSTQCMYMWVSMETTGSLVKYFVCNKIHHQYYMWRLAAWCVHVGGCLGKPQVPPKTLNDRRCICVLYTYICKGLVSLLYRLSQDFLGTVDIRAPCGAQN